jgi:DNA-binding winged helix-turn-helix (wHTH) protein
VKARSEATYLRNVLVQSEPVEYAWLTATHPEPCRNVYARVKLAQRKGLKVSAHDTDQIFRFAAFELDVKAGELRRAGVRLPVQGRPLQVLAALLRTPGRVVTTDELRAELWPADTFVDFDHGVRNAVARLRALLDDTAERPRYIETLPRRGYRFIGNLAIETPADLQPEPVRSSESNPGKWWNGRRQLALAGLGCLAGLAATVIWMAIRSEGKSTADHVVFVSHMDLTQRSGAPSAVGRPFGYFCGMNMVVYRGVDGHLHDCYWPVSHVHHEDLTMLSKSPPPAGEPYAYTLEEGNVQIVLFKGVDGHAHALNWRYGPGAVNHEDLSDLSNAPQLAGNPRGYEVSSRGVQAAVFRGIGGALNAVFRSGHGLRHSELTTVSQAPVLAGDPVGYYCDAHNLQAIVYRAVDGRLHRVYWSTGSDRIDHDDLTGLSRAPAPIGNPVVVVASTYGEEAVFYRGTDKHLHELVWSTGPIRHEDLTAGTNSPAAAGDPTAYFAAVDGRYHVVYRDSEGHIQELHWMSGEIKRVDLTNRSGAPNAGEDPSAYYVPADNLHHVVYRSIDGHIQELHWTNLSSY